MDLIPPSKDTIWQTRLKRKIQQFVAYREIHLIKRNKHWLRVKGWKIYQANGSWKQAGVTIFISEKVDFKFTLIKRDKEGHSIPIQGEIHQKEIIIINLCAPNVNAPNFIKHTLKDLKTYIDSNPVVVGDFNISPSPIDRSSKQKIIKEILELNHTIDQMDLADVYRIFHPTCIQYTFF
jgi:exonuclease III